MTEGKDAPIEDLRIIRREGMTYLCAVPQELGRVVKLELKHGKVIARGENGMTMIVPAFPKR